MKLIDHHKLATEDGKFKGKFQPQEWMLIPPNQINEKTTVNGCNHQ